MSTHKLRLGPLASTQAVKLTFSCSAALKADLERYAALHAQTWGQAVDATALIPHMLETFMARDRGFRSSSATKPPAPPTGPARSSEPSTQPDKGPA